MSVAEDGARASLGASDAARAPLADVQLAGTSVPDVPLPDLAVIDVSFISLTKVLPAVLECLTESAELLALVKPQFEVGRGRVGRGGVVREARDRRSALLAVGLAARELGVAVRGYCSSGLPGPKGNRETFVWLARGAGWAAAVSGAPRAASAEDVERMAAEVEP
jgi:23S rRNA (cytidine1920-2'-O)/16S rRNA (cytidine1409-2'-O)-methyltransferase